MSATTAAARPRPGSGGSVMLDLGARAGALVLYPGERFRGTEIEISPARDPAAPRVHTGVLDRPTSSGSVLAATFGCLAEGDYVVWLDATTPGPTVTVAGGAVTEVAIE